MNRSIRIFCFFLPALFIVGCVPAPATLPSPSVPSVPTSLPSPIPTPSDGMPTPPSIPGLPSPSSGSDSPSTPSMPQPLPGDGESGDSGSQASKGDVEGGQVVLEDSEGEGGEEGDEAGSESESQSGTGTGETESENVSLEDSVPNDEAEPTFEEPTFEESSSSAASATRGGLDQETLEELERVLGQELDTFDSSINREQRNAEGQSDEPTGGPVPVIVFEEYPDEGSDNSSGGGAGSGGGSGAEASGSGGGGDGNVSVAVKDAQIPPPNPDDDIVARQLREAAIAEIDPELKQRLWEEYYRYTGTQ